jgi:uncharacterized repeat protein (TIGR03803 family)
MEQQPVVGLQPWHNLQDDSRWVLTTLVSFDGANGKTPLTRLVEGSDGSFYGTTAYGGVTDRGTVFKVTSAGR